jgi:hypothetical protein
VISVWNLSSSSRGVLQIAACLTARDGGGASILRRSWPTRGCCAGGRVRRAVNVLETVVMTNTGQLTSDAIYTGRFISPSGIYDLCGTVAGMVRRRGACQQREIHSKFLSYFTIARYVDA